MDIVLTQKDADWVAAVIRRRIEEMNTHRSKALNDITSREKMCIKLAELVGVNPEGNTEGNNLSDVINKDKSEIDSKYFAKLEEYERILELMICGSN